MSEHDSFEDAVDSVVADAEWNKLGQQAKQDLIDLYYVAHRPDQAEPIADTTDMLPELRNVLLQSEWDKLTPAQKQALIDQFNSKSD